MTTDRHFQKAPIQEAPTKITLFDPLLETTNAIGKCNLIVIDRLKEDHRFSAFSVAVDSRHRDLVAWTRIPAPRRPLLLMELIYLAGSRLRYDWHRLLRRSRGDIVQVSACYAWIACDVAHEHFCRRSYFKRFWRANRPDGIRRLLNWMDLRLYSAIEPWMYRRAKVIVVPSNGLAREIAAEYPFAAGKLRCIPNPVDVEAMRRPDDFRREELRRSLGVPPGATMLVFVALGHFERKGLPLVLEALTHTFPGRDVHLTVVGGVGDLIAAYRRKAAKLGVGSKVHFAGTHADTRPFLWAADAQLFPSAYETFSLVTLEAAAAGLPTIGTLVNGVEDFMRDGVNGIAVERTVESVVAGVGRFLALSPEDRRRMGEQAATDVLRFRPDDVAEMWRNLYSAIENNRNL